MSTLLLLSVCVGQAADETFEADFLDSPFQLKTYIKARRNLRLTTLYLPADATPGIIRFALSPRQAFNTKVVPVPNRQHHTWFIF